MMAFSLSLEKVMHGEAAGRIYTVTHEYKHASIRG